MVQLSRLRARVCNGGSLMFLLLGPQNYQMHPKGVKRIGCIMITIVPNNEIRCLNLFYKHTNIYYNSNHASDSFKQNHL